MIILTAKLPRHRKLTIGVAVAALACCAALVLTLGGGPAREASASAVPSPKGVKSNEDRVAYLESLGWLTAAQPSAEEALTLPTKFDEAYQAYLTLQRSQGFDLEKYAGETIKRYTYQVKNYPGLQENIWACLLVCKHQIIGGEIFCNQGDGFTQSLEFPMKASQ